MFVIVMDSRVILILVFLMGGVTCWPKISYTNYTGVPRRITKSGRNDRVYLLRVDEASKLNVTEFADKVTGVIVRATTGEKVDREFVTTAYEVRRMGLRMVLEHAGKSGDGSRQADLFLKTAFTSFGRPAAAGRYAGVLAVVQGEQSMDLKAAEDFVRRYKEVTDELPFILGGSYLERITKGVTTLLTDCPLLVMPDNGMPVEPLSGWSSYSAWVAVPPSEIVPNLPGVEGPHTIVVVDSVNLENNIELALQLKATVMDTIQLIGNPGIPWSEIAVLINRYY